jgi:hypothetical protein
MNAERWGQIEQLYNAALKREEKDRDKFIAEACRGDTELRRDVKSLLDTANTTETFLEKPAVEFPAPVSVDNSPRRIQDDDCLWNKINDLPQLLFILTSLACFLVNTATGQVPAHGFRNRFASAARTEEL